MLYRVVDQFDTTNPFYRRPLVADFVWNRSKVRRECRRPTQGEPRLENVHA